MSVQLSLHPESCSTSERPDDWTFPLQSQQITSKPNILGYDCKIKAVLLVLFKEINVILHFTFSLNSFICLNEEFKVTIEYLWYSSKTNTVDQGAF